MKNNLGTVYLLIASTVICISCGKTQDKENLKKDSVRIGSSVKIYTETGKDTVLNSSFHKVEELINNSINDSAFPGAVLLVWQNGNIIFEKPFGHLTYNNSPTLVTSNTIYDMASLTKVIATTTAAMICVDRNLFNIEDRVAKYIPEFAVNRKENITIKNLLMHNSGLPAFKKYYALYNRPYGVLNDIFSSSLSYPTGKKTVYSDLGMITLGKIIEKVTGKTLDEFCNQEIFKPLGMNDTFFNPPASLRCRIAPTEYDKYWRKRLIWGEVHDETASMLKGVAGNAGLFSTAVDISKVLQMLLKKGLFEGKRIIDSATVCLFTSRQSSGRGLGWDMKSSTASSAGKLFSDQSYGHTGFTGTSVWTDPVRDLFVVFLTNRIYPSRTDNKIIKIRPELHDLIIKAAER
jgi:CubicO group peptidase (beta-lactamase class C family)